MSETTDQFDISPDEELIEVEIDGLLTPVYKTKWDKNQQDVINDVRDARASLRFEDEGSPAFQDYNDYVDTFGQDGEPDDEVE